MSASPRTYPRLRVEATDPATPGARLAKLAYHRAAEINALARANPGLPDGTLLHFLDGGDHAAWTNPRTMLRLFESVTPEMQNGARQLVYHGNAPDLAATVTRDWWANATDPEPMLEHLAHQGAWHQQTAIHRRAVGALCACVRASGLLWIASEGEAILSEFESWSHGGPRPTRTFETRLYSADSTTFSSLALHDGMLARAADPLPESGAPRDPHHTGPAVSAILEITSTPGLCDVLRAAIPDPTEGL